MMSKPTLANLATLIVATSAALALAACGRDEASTAGQKLDSAIAKTEAATDKATTAASNAVTQVAEQTADAVITATINAELAKDADLSALKIDVDTRDGKVMLSGTAPSTTARERATSLANGVKGVTSVENRLEVRG